MENFNNLNMELILAYYKTYNRWPNKKEYMDISYLINNYNTDIPNLYRPVFKKLIYLTGEVTKQEIYDATYLLIEFYETFDRPPKENEVYKNVNLYNFVYALKFFNLPIKKIDKNSLNELDFFYGVRNHKKILTLIKYFYIYNKWPEKDEVFENISVGSLISKIKRETISISNEDNEILELLDFFNSTEKNHSKVLLLIEFKKEFQRLPKCNEVYKGVNVHQLLNCIKKGRLSISSNDEKLLKSNGLFKRNSYYKYLALLEFYDKYKRWPKRHEKFNNINIGIFAQSVKSGDVYITDKEKNELCNRNFIFYHK